MTILETFVILLTTLSTFHATEQNTCPTSLCGGLNIHSPFKLEYTQTHTNNDCPYTLTCTSNSIDGDIVVELPGKEQFYVRDISYRSSLVQLYDPNHCLLARLMHGLDLSSSPFMAVDYENYTYYMCPASILMLYEYLIPIGCLSNSTNSTIATSFPGSEIMLEWGCEAIKSQVLPVLYSRQFEFDGVNSDLYLAWNSSRCPACELPPVGVKSKRDPWAEFVSSPFFVPALISLAIVFIICLLTATRTIASRRSSSLTDPPTDADRQPISAAAPPAAPAGGMDESKINACTELVVLRTFPEPDLNTCAICLEVYCPQQHVRTIPKCHHSFHAVCIQQWLTKNTTCPVCRTILSDNIDI